MLDIQDRESAPEHPSGPEDQQDHQNTDENSSYDVAEPQIDINHSEDSISKQLNPPSNDILLEERRPFIYKSQERNSQNRKSTHETPV